MDIYGTLPEGSIVFAACDGAYFLDHASTFVASADKHNKDVHIHVCNPSKVVYDLAEKMIRQTSVKLTISFSDFEDQSLSAEEMRTYFACLRFLVLPDLLKTAERILTLDIDCFIVNNFCFPRKDIAYFPRESLPGTIGWEQQGTKVAAGAVYLTRNSVYYAEQIAQKIRSYPLRWFVDQIALSQVFESVPNEMVEHFDSQFMDWEFTENSIIWTGKGQRKYNNQRYLQKKMEYNKCFQ